MIEKLREICNKSLFENGLTGEKYANRLEDELKDIDAQNESEYFLDLYEKKVKYTKNENNLLVPYLLGIVDEFDINAEPTYDYGDFPDVDLDLHPALRDKVKNEWAPKHFGQEYVANIGSYNTFGIKSALIDMARVFGKDRGEILALTTKIDLKDDEGNVLTWDKALEIYPELKEYCDKNPDVADAAKKLINRNRSMGKHAGGLIISSKEIRNFVPLVKGKDDDVVCAWTEGLHDQDLGPVGFIKYDILVLTSLQQKALACKLIKERHNNIPICAKEGMEDWSDDSFLNDEESLKMANEGDLKCIFQFDSDGIRQLAKKGGVNSFNDLVAYNCLYRPGPMQMGMHERYIERKRGREKYEIHPKLEPILGRTYGVMTEQEQIIKILNVVGLIPQKDCEIIRKAISKKKEEYFGKYKSQFIENGQKVLNCSLEEIEELWKQIDAFSGYGFNRCLSGDTEIYDATRGCTVTIENMYNNRESNFYTNSISSDNKVSVNLVEDVIKNGCKDVFKIKTFYGEIKATENHKFLTLDGWKKLKDLKVGDHIGVSRKLVVKTRKFWPKHKIIVLAGLLSEGNTCHPSSLYFYNNNIEVIDDFVNSAHKFGKANVCKISRNEKFEVRINSGVSHPYYKQPKLISWARNLKIWDCKATQKFVPNKIFELTDNNIKLFLGRLWTGDGFVFDGRSYPYYATSSLQLAKDVKNLLLRLGILSCVKKKKFKYRGDYKIGYTVSIFGYESLDLFIKHISKYIVGKDEQIKTLKNRKTGKWGKFSCRDLIPKKVLENIKSEAKVKNMLLTFLADNAKVSYNLFFENKKKVGYSRNTVCKIAEILKSKNLISLSKSDIFWDQITSIDYFGKEETFDITIANDHNFVANGFIVHNSHSVCYSYIASQLLWLKSHYSLEFFAAILAYENGTDKLKEYRTEAENHDITVNGVDINKSGVKCQIVDESLYYGLSNLKGIGENVAQEIVNKQPYRSFRDFLDRFGTDASVLKPVLGLRLFKDADPITLYKYSEWYKKNRKRRMGTKNRYEETTAKIKQDIEALIGCSIDGQLDEEKMDEYKKLKKRFKKCTETFEAKRVDEPLPDVNEIVLDEDTTLFQMKFDEKFMKILNSEEESERQYYGFLWNHPLRKCPGYKGNLTFENHRERDKIGYVEFLVNSVAKTISKKKTVYWLIKAEDVSGEGAQVQVWEEDWERFKDDIVAGALLRVELAKPTYGFRRFTLNSPPKHLRHKLPKSKSVDFRVIVLGKISV